MDAGRDMFRKGFHCIVKLGFRPLQNRISVETLTSFQLTDFGVQGYISTLPAVDRPEAFGQHANAEIAFRIEETASLLDGLIGLQPSVKGAGHAAGREEEVLRITQEVIEQVNGKRETYREEEREREWKERGERRGGGKRGERRKKIITSISQLRLT
jgi:hypothetical protein